MRGNAKNFFLAAMVCASLLIGSYATAALMSGSLSYTGALSGEMIAINAFQGNAFDWSIDYDATGQLWSYTYSFRPSGTNRGPSFFDIETAAGIGDLTTSFAYGGTIPDPATLATLTPTSAQFSSIVPIDYRIDTAIPVAPGNTKEDVDPLTGVPPFAYEAWLGAGPTALPVHVNSVMNGVQVAVPSRTFGMTNGPSQPGLFTGYNAGGTVYQVVMTTKSSPMWGRFFLDGGDWTSHNGWLMAYNREYDNPTRPPFVAGAAQSGWIAVPGDSSPPAVQSFAPANGASGVSVNATATVSFNMDIDPGSITVSSFTLSNVVNVPGTVVYDKASRTASFIPASLLAPGTVYTVSVSTGVKDLNGNALAAPRSWSFSTASSVDVTPPTVLSTTPANGASGVNVAGVVSATFSLNLDPATVNAGTFTVSGLPGTVSYDQASRTATFTPRSALSFSTGYTATLSSGIRSAGGHALSAGASWSFTTAAPPDLTPPTVISVAPANGATVVGVKSRLNVVFSEPLNPATVDATTFSVRDAGGQAVDGSVGYQPATNSAVFMPSLQLSYYATYTATLSGGIKDPAGNPLAAQSWSFTTEPLYGDLNGSGGPLSLTDALMALRFAVGLQTLSEAQKAACDVAPLVDGKPHPDGKIDGGDVIVILRRVVGLDTW